MTALPGPREDETLDRLLRGRISLLQSRKGYRTSVDAMLLGVFGASFASTSPTRVVDLGAGSGLVAILVGLAWPQAALQLIERQPQLAERAGRNLQRHGLDARAQVVQHDLADGAPPVCADLLLSNPPFYRRTGRMLPNHPERRDAHYESTADLETFARMAAMILAEGGTTCWVYPAEGELRLRAALEAAGLGEQIVRRVSHIDDGGGAVRVLVAARKGAPSEVVLPPWALYEREPPDGLYHAEIEAFLADLPEFPGLDGEAPARPSVATEAGSGPLRR